jgi:hypothetical protein
MVGTAIGPVTIGTRRDAAREFPRTMLHARQSQYHRRRLGDIIDVRKVNLADAVMTICQLPYRP